MNNTQNELEERLNSALASIKRKDAALLIARKALACAFEIDMMQLKESGSDLDDLDSEDIAFYGEAFAAIEAALNI